MLQQDLNPRDRDWPENEPGIGKIVKEQFFECESGPKLLTVVEYDGFHYLRVQDCCVRDGQVEFGHSVWLRVDDGTARLTLQLADQMLRETRGSRRNA